jgi:hypothetical protein
MQSLMEEDETGERHPPKESDLKGCQREGIGLNSNLHAFPSRETAHGGNGKILKDDPEQVGQEKVQHIFRPQRDPCQREAKPEDDPFPDDISKSAS